MSIRSVLFAGVSAMVMGLGAPANAAELRLRGTGAVKHSLVELAEAFEKQTGHKVISAFGTAGAVSAQIVSGEALENGPVDVVFSASDSLSAAAMKARLVDVPLSVVGRVRIGIGVRNGEKAPDISTPEALKAALLATPSFATGDPVAGGTAGIHFSKVIEKLGLIEAVKSKAILRNGGLLVMKEVADGKAAFGFTQTSEIGAVPGVMIAGYLPDSLQLVTAYAGAVTKDAGQVDIARAFLAFVTGAAGQAVFKARGFEVGP